MEVTAQQRLLKQATPAKGSNETVNAGVGDGYWISLVIFAQNPTALVPANGYAYFLPSSPGCGFYVDTSTGAKFSKTESQDLRKATLSGTYSSAPAAHDWNMNLLQ